MKYKILNITLLLILVFGLTGCDLLKGKTGNINKMIDEAEILNWKDVHSTILGNKAKAEDYENKLYIYTAKVYSIEEDYTQLEYNDPIQAYLDKEVLKTLESGDIITVVGTLKDTTSFPKLKNAVKLDDKTIKDRFIMAITEKSGSSAKNMTYSNYKVDSKTHLITSYETKGASSGTHKLKYDKNKNLIEDKIESALYGTETITYTYNKDNTAATESETKTKNGKTENGNTWTYTYEKDDKDRVIKKVGVNTTSADKYTMTYTYEYDNKNNIIKETQTSPKSSYVIDYEYDNFNNKVKEISYNTNKPYSKTTITNTYSIIAKK